MLWNNDIIYIIMIYHLLFRLEISCIDNLCDNQSFLPKKNLSKDSFLIACKNFIY